MSSPPEPVPLENDSRNPCVGCGPEHPSGLHLAFTRQGDRVSTALVASERHQGWPGRLHSGILYLALLETSNWTLFGFQNRVGIPTRTSALGTKRWVAVGETLILSGRLTAPAGTTAQVRVEALDGKGQTVATLERDYDLPDRSTFLKRMGYSTCPPGLEEALPE